MCLSKLYNKICHFPVIYEPVMFYSKCSRVNGIALFLKSLTHWLSKLECFFLACYVRQVWYIRNTSFLNFKSFLLFRPNCVWLSACLPVCLPACRPAGLPACLPVCLSVCLWGTVGLTTLAIQPSFKIVSNEILFFSSSYSNGLALENEIDTLLQFFLAPQKKPNEQIPKSFLPNIA